MLGRVLLVDRDSEAREALAHALSTRGFEVTGCGSRAEALAFVLEEELDAVVSDLDLGDESGISLCREVAARREDAVVVLMAAIGSVESAVEAIRAGAYDYLTKPVPLDDLVITLTRACQHSALRQEVRRLRRAVRRAQGFGEMLGASPAMTRVYEMIARVAETDATVLITGESGTGKELAANATHERSRRAGASFVAINCAALPEPLLESELFGHTRGAFTDAKTSRAGLFVKANGGTLFLDEIGEMPLGMQAKLLRVLQERSVRPIGAEAEISVDVRIIAATNRNLEEEVAARRFREDLFYRINVVQLALPPLRAREGDVLLLAQSFLARFAGQSGREVRGISRAAAERLLAYHWPGNVRELSNCMERAVILSKGVELRLEDLPERLLAPPAVAAPAVPEPPASLPESALTPTTARVAGAAPSPSHSPSVDADAPEILPLEDVERRHILWALERLGGNKLQAAAALGIDRRTLYRKLARYQGEPELDAEPEDSA